jgi:cation-transporting ATPase 13A2
MQEQREKQQIIEGDDQLGYLSVKVTSTPDVDMTREKEMLLNSVSHLLIENDDGDPELAEVRIVETSKHQIDIEFMYRFIKFRLNYETRRFEPVVFDCIHDPVYLKSRYGKGI